MNDSEWEMCRIRLAAEGWDLKRTRIFKPMFGRYWMVEARHRMSGLRREVEAPTLKIALKKLSTVIHDGPVRSKP